MYCANCGAGICGSTKYRGGDNNFETSCPKCDNAHEARLLEAEEEIAALKQEIETLKEGGQ